MGRDITLIPLTRYTATETGTIIDVSDVNDIIAFVLYILRVSGTNPTLDVSIENIALTLDMVSSGPPMQIISETLVSFAQQNAIATVVIRKNVDYDITATFKKPWNKLRARLTIGGTASPYFDCAVIAIGK